MLIQDPACVFCQIIAGIVEASWVYRDEEVCAFMDLFPVNPGHLLVVPNRHSPLIHGIEEETLRTMFSVGRKLADALQGSGMVCEGVNIYLADGRAAGQVVPHAHLHVIPRYRGDRCGLHLHSGPAQELSRRELDAAASRIQSALGDT